MSDARNLGLAALGLGIIGVGTYALTRKKTDAETEDPGVDTRTAVYNPYQTRQFTTGPDRGASISAITQNSRGQTVAPGIANYRYGNTVICNAAQTFGAKSYRHSMCLPSPTQRPNSRLDGATALFGQGRHSAASNPGGWGWDSRQYLDGLGWDNNGTALIARSWSCNPTNPQGTNNATCRSNRIAQALNLGAAAGGLGFFPYSSDSKIRSAWINAAGDGVPLIAYNADPQRPGSRAYTNVAGNRTNAKSGFVDDEGVAWIESKDSENFYMITDENPDIVYFVAMLGARGRKTAFNKKTNKFVNAFSWRPTWKNLSNAESFQYATTGGAYAWKIDPWSISGSPWETQDLMRIGSWTSNGQTFDLDYSKGRNTLNPTFKEIARQAGAPPTGGRSEFVYFKRAALVGNSRKCWPSVNYGLVYPWRQPNTPNGSPYDFCMPVFTSYWAEMPVVVKQFSGDAQNG